VEREAARLFRASVAPGERDDALNHAAVEMALACLQDEALDHAAVENALARLERTPALGESVRRWLGSARWLRPAACFPRAATTTSLTILCRDRSTTIVSTAEL
jgi:hypothetical protein